MSAGNDKLERELESFLADDSRVAALYRRLPKDEPDAKLDAAILAQARAAVAPRRTRPRWLAAVSAAAAIVVVAGLAYRVGPQVWNERSAVSEKAEQRVAAPAAAPEKPSADALRQTAPLDAPVPQAETTAPSRPPLNTSSNAIRKQDTSRAEADKLQDRKRNVEEQKTTNSTFAKQAAQGQIQTEKETVRDSATNAPAGALPEQPARMKSLASPPRLDAAPAPPAEPAPAAPSPKPQSAVQPNAFPSAAGAAYTPASAPPPAAAARAPVRESAQSAADIEVNLYPEHWIADIHQMLKDGRRDDAIRNLTEFRKRYPDYKLPDDLRDLK